MIPPPPCIRRESLGRLAGPSLGKCVSGRPLMVTARARNQIACEDPGKCVAQNPARRFARRASFRFSAPEKSPWRDSVSTVSKSPALSTGSLPLSPPQGLPAGGGWKHRKGGMGASAPICLIWDKLIRARFEPGFTLSGSNWSPYRAPF